MCGIHGVINKSSYARSVFEAFIKDGYVAGSLRGMDSSGIFQLDKANKPFMYKAAVPGPQFLDSKLTGQFFRDAASCPLTIGHVRAATAGKISMDNAHPFCVNRADGTRLLGVHNGTLQGWSYKKGASQFDVDSEWALNKIAEEGADAFESFLGAFAFVWWDEKHKDKVFVARNTERPLHFVRTKDKSAMLLASEAGMLAWLAERNRIDTEETIYCFEPGKLYTIDMSGTELKWTKVNYPLYKTVYYTPPGMGNNNGNRSHWNPNNARWENRQGNSVDVCGLGNEGTNTNNSGKRSERKDPECGSEALEVIGSVKAALSDNRDKRFQRGKYAPNKQTPAAEPAAHTEPHGAAGKPKEQAEDDEYGDTYPKCRPDWYTVATATTAERNAAAEMGVMGELQYFVGIHYEPDTSELYGEIQDFVPGSGKVKYDSLMRMVSRAEARRWSIDTGKGCWVAVIGKREDIRHGLREYIVAPLNDKGIAALKQKAA